jgi:hypothetical protein
MTGRERKRDHMSRLWIVALGGVLSLLALLVILASQGLSLTSLVGLGLMGALALLASFWFGRRPSRTMEEIIHDVEGEAVLEPQRAAAPASGADLLTRRDGRR